MPMPATILAATTRSHFHDTQMTGSTGNARPDNPPVYIHIPSVFLCANMCALSGVCLLCPIDFLST